MDGKRFKNTSLWRPSTQSSHSSSRYSTTSPRQDTEKSYPSLGIIATETPARGHRLRRFWGRSLALILAPLIIAGYFIFIWQFFLKQDGPLKYGTFNESYIFYSWFVVGVFGLSVSRYGIIGIEASMLHDPFWRTKNAMQLMMHSGGSWGGAGGWTRCLIGFFHWKKSMAGRLWYLLSLVTMALFVGLPISGLSFELTDGYIQSSEHPTVIGRTWSNFHSRRLNQAQNQSMDLWKTGASVTLPGIGLAYTPPGLDRDQFKFLGSVPNSLPLDRDVPELFLAPQADSPINGEAWGLRLSYNCSVVESASEFTILGTKVDHFSDFYESGSSFNSTNSEIGKNAVSMNLWAYGETRIGPNNSPVWADADKFTASADSDDVNVSGILEYALWQIRLAPGASTRQGISITSNKRASAGEDVVDFDGSLDPSIPDMGSPWTRDAQGMYVVNDSFFSREINQIFPNDTTTAAPDAADPWKIQSLIDELAAPIGVRCHHMSLFGTAQLDAKTTSFTGFTPVPPVFNESRMTAHTPMFGISASKMLPDHYFDLFTATNAPAPVNEGPSTFYTSYVKPEKLKQAVMRAYAQDALALMYDGLPDVSQGYQHSNLTSSRKGKVLELGIVPPLVPAIWLSLWAFICSLIGLAYGFRRRWSAALDGYTLFRFGADLGGEVRDLSSVGAFEECERLWDLPGFVGDAREGDAVGYISLVRGDEVADKGKLYV